jgi:serine phosphatase RsbU (regulator of sigma subunit)
VYQYSVQQSARQGALEQEFKSAQEVQRILIPETLPPLPGYAVTSAYIPAQQVGGDFFQLIALEGGADAKGSTLLVLGDVSGKGLKAAMSVALIVGAVRTLAAMLSDPAEILAGLNERLYGRLQNGFATCLMLRLEADGACAIANAGHLSPFLNDRELELPAALPLGIVQDVAFETTTVHLGVGDRLTLYTDGLLEARNHHSGELYGFDRVRELIATRPDAHAASEVAVAFGQEDDITVLTVTRLAVGVESTTLLVAPELVSAV